MTSKRLVQLFMSYKSDAPGPAIFEVEITSDKTPMCSCPGFAARGKCKHCAVVKKRIDDNDGMYPFNFLAPVSDEEIKEALKTEGGFRTFIIQHAKVEVI